MTVSIMAAHQTALLGLAMSTMRCCKSVLRVSKIGGVSPSLCTTASWTSSRLNTMALGVLGSNRGVGGSLGVAPVWAEHPPIVGQVSETAADVVDVAPGVGGGGVFVFFVFVVLL